MENPKSSPGGLANTLWLIYTAAAIAGALLVLTIYVNAYDDNGLTERLRGLGAFVRRAMGVLSFPLGLPLGALANTPLERIFACEAANEPCGVFIDWWTHFSALLAQIVILRWLARRPRPSGGGI